jgi:Na+/proline symporter
MAKYGHQLRNQYLIASFIDPMLQVTIMMIGLAAIALYPNLEAENVMPHIIKTLLPIGTRGLAMSGVLAIILSTADSYLHSAGILFTHDLIDACMLQHKKRT